MKCILLDIKSTTIITALNLVDFRSSIIKFTLIVFHLVLDC